MARMSVMIFLIAVLVFAIMTNVGMRRIANGVEMIMRVRPALKVNAVAVQNGGQRRHPDKGRQHEYEIGKSLRHRLTL